VVVESEDCISFNSIDPFNASSALQPGRFIVRSSAGGDPIAIDEVSSWSLLLFAPLQWIHVYRPT
jgi:hypothetical protein